MDRPRRRQIGSSARSQCWLRVGDAVQGRMANGWYCAIQLRFIICILRQAASAVRYSRDDRFPQTNQFGLARRQRAHSHTAAQQAIIKISLVERMPEHPCWRRGARPNSRFRDVQHRPPNTRTTHSQDVLNARADIINPANFAPRHAPVELVWLGRKDRFLVEILPPRIFLPTLRQHGTAAPAGPAPC